MRFIALFKMLKTATVFTEQLRLTGKKMKFLASLSSLFYSISHSIPRKTLRNWMKRMHIKSQFPMPKQLKQAAERKKNSQVTGVRNSKIIMNAIELS